MAGLRQRRREHLLRSNGELCPENETTYQSREDESYLSSKVFRYSRAPNEALHVKQRFTLCLIAAITATDLKKAMDNLVKPNENEARGMIFTLSGCGVY